MSCAEIFFSILTLLATIISPLLVAYFVYEKWHGQKGKEVIADEAKSLIYKLSECSDMSSYLNLKYQGDTGEYLKGIELKHFYIVNEIKYKLEVIYNLTKVKYSQEDKKLKEHIDEYQNAIDKFVESIRRRCEINEVESDLLNFLNKNNVLKSHLCLYALYKK